MPCCSKRIFHEAEAAAVATTHQTPSQAHNQLPVALDWTSPLQMPWLWQPSDLPLLLPRRLPLAFLLPLLVLPPPLPPLLPFLPPLTLRAPPRVAHAPEWRWFLRSP